MATKDIQEGMDKAFGFKRGAPTPKAADSTKPSEYDTEKPVDPSQYGSYGAAGAQASKARPTPSPSPDPLKHGYSTKTMNDVSDNPDHSDYKPYTGSAKDSE